MSQALKDCHARNHYFFTVVTHRRKPIFADPNNVDLLKAAMRMVKQKHAFDVHAMVVLPDHLHGLWALPDDDNDLSKRWRLIKRYFSIQIGANVNHPEELIWQPRLQTHTIHTESDFQQHMDCIHYNPVKHGLVKQPRDWPHSTFHYWVQNGRYDIDWGATEPLVLSEMEGCE